DDRRAADLPPRDADVAADALADVVEPALVDLLRKEGIRDRWPTGGDDVERAVVDRFDHHVRARETPHAQHRLLRDALHGLLPGEHAAGLVETGRGRVLAPLGNPGDVDVPDVHDFVDELHEGQTV